MRRSKGAIIATTEATVLNYRENLKARRNSRTHERLLRSSATRVVVLKAVTDNTYIIPDTAETRRPETQPNEEPRPPELLRLLEETTIEVIEGVKVPDTPCAVNASSAALNRQIKRKRFSR